MGGNFDERSEIRAVGWSIVISTSTPAEGCDFNEKEAWDDKDAELSEAGD
jgi:hypothetical protein